jgi:hypothetical protein
MPRSLPTLFQRLRRHRGGWMLLIAALMIKIATGTICVLDGPGLIATATASEHTLTVGNVQADTASANDGDACLLGEAGGCHCACAHAVTLPTTLPALAAVIALPVVIGHLPAAPTPLASPSPLRPPIA